MTIKQVITEGDKPVKVWNDELDPRSREQQVNISKLPFIHHHAAAMPDVHAGIGATIGSVGATADRAARSQLRGPEQDGLDRTDHRWKLESALKPAGH